MTNDLPTFEEFFWDSPNLLSIVGLDGTRKVVNPAWTTVLGWSREELLVSGFIELMHPEDRDRVQTSIGLLTPTAPVEAFRARYRRKDRSYLWIEWDAWVVGDDIFGVGRDVTDRERIEAALVESEAKSRSVLGIAMSGIITIDADGTIQGFNPAAERIFGYAAAEVAGTNVSALMPEPYRSEHDAYLARYLATGERRTIGHVREVEGRRKDGSTFPMELAVDQVALGDRQLFTGVVRDIGERKAAQQALEEARAAAEAANEAKSEFLSRMSHELRTPLNAMLGFAQLIGVSAASDQERESADMIVSAGRHLLALINEVLDITQIETGHLELSLDAVELGAVLREALDLIRPEADRHRVELVDRQGADLHVLADRQRLKQVALNLLSNAVKYSADGGRVEVEVEAAPDGRVRVLVRDDGPGIPPESVGRLFVPFERLGAELSGVEGTGLGLAVSARLIEAQGGRIGVDSTLGRGSTFWFELAAADRPPADGAAADLAPPVHAVAPLVGTVLCVEDNPSNLRLVERILEQRPGLRLLTARDGATGLALAREHRPGLVLLDVNLPDLSGDQVLRQLRAVPGAEATPVVVVSADASEEQRERLAAAGADAYLPKPVDLFELLRVVDAALETT